MKAAVTASRQFSVDIIRFIHYLRMYGFSVASGETVDVFRALDVLNLADETEVRHGLRTVLCSTRAEHEVFDSLFAAFFRDVPDRRGIGELDSGQLNSGREKAGSGTGTEENAEITDDTANETLETSVGRPLHSESTAGMKEHSFLQAVRQSQAESEEHTTVWVPSEHFSDMLAAAKAVVRNVDLRPNRRWYPMPKGDRVDLRRTLRRSLSTGGCPVDPARSGHRKQKARFLLLCDGSRSMTPYAGAFLQFAYALNCHTKHIELFLFSTRLRRVTPLLRKARPPNMPSFKELGAEWSGGTRIGECLNQVVRKDGLRLLNRNTVVIIFSDGLDSGDPGDLERVMRVIKYRAGSVIWLNPLASMPGYEPKARGMRTALPYVNLFAEAHDAASFYHLAQRIRKGRDSVEGKR